MSRLFLERFKDRITTLGPQGDLQVTSSLPVQSTLISVSQQSPGLPEDRHPRPIKATSEYVLSPSTMLEPANKTIPPPRLDHSPARHLQPIREITSKLSLSPQRPGKKTRTVPPKSKSANQSMALVFKGGESYNTPGGFTPYTLKDYKMTHFNSAVQLQGLGSTTGSLDWERKKELKERQRVFSTKLFIENANRLAYIHAKPKGKSPETVTSDARSRALKFARTIKLPRLQTYRLTSSKDSSVQMNREEEELKEAAVALRAKLLM